MKIGVLLLSNNFAGAERVIKDIVVHSKSKSDFVLFLSDEICSFFQIKGLKVYNLGKLFNKSLFGRFLTCKNIAKTIDVLIEKEKILVLNPVLEYSFLVSLFLKPKIPFCSSLHGEEINHLSSFSKFLPNFIVKQTLDKSQKLISVSTQLIQNLPEKYKSKTVVIPNGVDSKTFKPLKIKQKKKVILFAGRFIELKGIKEILEVAKQLPQYEFWFAGQGELNDLIVGKNVKNLGFQTTENLVELYNQATICVFPSHRESFGLTGLEAMSCGKAVIATPLGFSEYIENGKDGIIIPAKDETALKNAIVDLMTNEKKRKMLEKNAKNKALNYSWEKTAEQYLRVFKEIEKTKL